MDALENKKTQESAVEPVIIVDNVDMVFNIANEQLNSLKEYFIKAMRRELVFREFKALEGISLTVNKGDVYGIVGTNGSGKSTLLKIVAGVLEPSRGSCTIKGTIAPLIELGAGFDPELTARENVYLNGSLLGYTKEFIDENFQNIIDFAEIGDFVDMPLKNYSSGMVARIAFAIATATVPDILIVDEALSVGDLFFQQKCERRIKELVEEHGTTLLFVSHSIGQVESLCQKAIWIEKGRMRMQGDVKKVCAAYHALNEKPRGVTEGPHSMFNEKKRRIALFANPRQGMVSFSWRAKIAFEHMGHSVYFFTPKLFPFLYEDDAVQAQLLKRFLEVQSIDVVMLADGLHWSSGNYRWPEHITSGVICGAVGHCPTRTGDPLDSNLDFALAPALPDYNERVLKFSGAAIAHFELAPDRSYQEAELANKVAYRPGIVCLQDATPARIKAMRHLVDQHPGGAVRPYCFGLDWPSEWTVSNAFSEFAYISKMSTSAVIFDDSEGSAWGSGIAQDWMGSLMLADGLNFIDIEGNPRDLGLAGNTTLEDQLEQALKMIPARDRDKVVAHGGSSDELPMRVSDENGNVCIMGYFGMGNFGDEYILSLVDKRIRMRFPMLKTISLSENPQHTLVERGVYAITLENKYVLDCALSGSHAALVTAGLLFDQGIRWTMGKAELLSSMKCSTIPGITGYSTLAYLNKAPFFYYGIGAGPLDVADGRKLIGLTGSLGATFLVRDRDTYELIRSCDVDESRLMLCADTAFLGCDSASPFVDKWLSDHQIDLSSSKIFIVSLREYEGLPAEFGDNVAAALCRVFKDRSDVVVACCVLDPGDRELCEHVVQAMSEEVPCYLFDCESNVEAIADLMDRAWAGLSMRYHCSLLLNRGGKPCVGIDYLPKVSSLYADMGASDLLLGMNADENAIGDAVQRMVNEYDERSARIAKEVERLAARSEQGEKALIDAISGSIKARGAQQEREEIYLSNRSVSDWELGTALSKCEELEKNLVEARSEAARFESEVREFEGSEQRKKTMTSKFAQLLKRS